MSSSTINSAKIILSALVLSGVGALYYNLLPMYLGAAQDYKGLSNERIGMLGFSFFLGYNLLTISAFFWIRKIDWRLVTAASLPVCCLALYASGEVGSFSLLIVCTIIAGVAFSALYGLGATILGDTENPARWYGAKIGLEAMIGAVLFMVLPSTLIADKGFDGLVFGMIITIIVLAPFLIFVPARGAKNEGFAGLDIPQEKKPVPLLAIWMTLIGTMFFFGAETTIWAFVERIGSIMEFDPAAVGNLLSITLFCALFGSLLAAGVGDRFGNIRPIIISAILFFFALFGLAKSADFMYYSVSACVVMFSVGYGLPYAFSEVADLDSDGRYVILTVPAVGIGAMLGPGIAGYLVQGSDFRPVLMFGGIVIIAAAAFLGSARRFVLAS